MSTALNPGERDVSVTSDTVRAAAAAETQGRLTGPELRIGTSGRPVRCGCLEAAAIARCLPRWWGLVSAITVLGRVCGMCRVRVVQTTSSGAACAALALRELVRQHSRESVHFGGEWDKGEMRNAVTVPSPARSYACKCGSRPCDVRHKSVQTPTPQCVCTGFPFTASRYPSMTRLVQVLFPD